MAIPRLIPIPFRSINGRPPLMSELAAWYKGDIVLIDGKYYLKDYSGNGYHADAYDSLLYLNGTDNSVSYGDVVVGDDWTIGVALILPTAFTDADDYAIAKSDGVFVGHASGDGHGVRFTVTIDSTDYTVDGSSFDVDDNSLHTIAASFRKGNQIALYIDGELVGTTDISSEGEVVADMNGLYLGSSGSDDYTEMYVKTFEILDQYLNIDEAFEYNALKSGSISMTYDIYEGDYRVTEYGFNIIETT